MRVSVWISAARPRTLYAAAAPVAVGTALAARTGRFHGVPALLCLAFALLVQIGTNFANDYFDFVKGADTASRTGPRRAVAAGLVTPAAMRWAAIATFASAFAVGLGLVPFGGPWLLAIGVASIACGLAYTGGPFPLGYAGLGDIFVFLFFGVVAVCATYFVQTGLVSGDTWLASVPVGLLAANILVVNNYRDVETDAAAGKRTLVVRFGRGFAKVQFALSHAVALAVPFAYLRRGHDAWCLLPLALAPLASRQVRRLRPDAAPAELISLLGQSGRYLGLYAALFAAGQLL